MFVKMKETLFNISGEKFDKNEKVEVRDVWLNCTSDKIYISVKLNDKFLITSIANVEVEE